MEQRGTPVTWRNDAACVGTPTDWFFPPRGAVRMTETRQAIATCFACPVRLECLIENIGESDGIYGGFAASRRAKMRRKLRAVPEDDRFDALVRMA